MLILTAIIITLLLLFVRKTFLRLMGSRSNSTLADDHLALTITVRSSMRPCVLEVDGISAREVSETMTFISGEYGSHLQQHLHLVHSADHLSVTIQPALAFSDVVNLVNQFAWSAQGHTHTPKTHYHVDEMTFGEVQLKDAEVELYVAHDEEEPSLVSMRIPDGSILAIDLGRDNIIEQH